MARIRTIKPEFPHSETIGALSRDARLLFIQLWTIVDDDGRARAASRMLASLLYPYDTDAGKLMDRWLDELESNQCIRRYEVDGAKYLDIPNWLKHQKIDRPSKSRLPAFANNREDSREIDEASSTDLGPVPSTLDLGPRTNIRAVAVATRTDEFEEFWKSYPKRDGRNPKAPARKKFLAALKSGAEARTIIAGASRYRAECQAKQQIGTPYVAMTVTWLNQQSWEDYAPKIVPTNATGPPPGRPSDEELRRKYGDLNERNNRNAAAGDGSTEPGDEGKLLREGRGVHRENGAAGNGPSGYTGVRSLGQILRETSALDALGAQGGAGAVDSGPDDADTVAGVVRH